MSIPKLTIVERTMLANQFRILAKLNGEVDATDTYTIKAEIVEGGYEGLYSMGEIFVEDTKYSDEETVETMDIMDMFNFIHHSIDSLSTSDRAKFTTDEIEKISYKGFDGNHDNHYFIQLMLFKMDRFMEYENVENNSHTRATLPRYQRILKKYNEIIDKNNPLTADKLKQLIAVA